MAVLHSVRQEWIILTGWGWLSLSFLPYTFVIIFIYSMAVSKISLMIFRIPDYYYSVVKVAIRVSVISFSTFMLQYAITHIFELASRLRSPAFNHLPGWRHNIYIYSHLGLFIATILGICLCLYISYRLNLRFTYKCLLVTSSDEHKQTCKALTLISVLTAPFIYLIPVEQIFWFLLWLGGGIRFGGG